MTRAWRDGEAWLVADGAPAGPSITVDIPSSRKGRGPYRMTRDEQSGVVLHQPPCEAWAHGHRNCRHVQEMAYRAEHAASAFLEDVSRLISESAWWANPVVAQHLVAAIVRLRDDVRNHLDANAAAARMAEQLSGETPGEKTAAAFDDFGRTEVRA